MDAKKETTIKNQFVSSTQQWMNTQLRKVCEFFVNLTEIKLFLISKQFFILVFVTDELFQLDS